LEILVTELCINDVPPPISGASGSLFDRTGATDDERIKSIRPLSTPQSLIHEFPLQGTSAEELIARTRRSIKRILHGEDDRLLLVIGPCSIHDPHAALEYADRLRELRERYAETLEVVMRVYFEKPRTSIGWKGLINDPGLDGTFRIEDGLRIARELLLEINAKGVPAGCEFLDVISPQYLGDLISWGAIGARTTESQVHRELASGLSAPIGFKNGTDGNVGIAVDAIKSARSSHHFMSVLKNGQVAIVETSGNEDCHVILRGGREPNYDAASVLEVSTKLRAAGLEARVMIDCSHGNSKKQPDLQIEVVKNISAQIAAGSVSAFGLMVESHLEPGAQAFVPGQGDPRLLKYGQSITDGCLGWSRSESVAEFLRDAIETRRQR
jgi:3-deoxy-7-phosphoheptulonate synthase